MHDGINATSEHGNGKVATGNIKATYAIQTTMSIEEGFVGELPNRFRWATGVRDYVWWAERSVQNFSQLRSERERQYGALGPTHVPWHRDVTQAFASTIIFAALAVEAALNFWGVVRLGTRRFSVIERSTTSQKIRETVGRITERYVDHHDPMLAPAKRLARLRNELVHAKSAVLDPNADLPPVVPPNLDDAVDAYQDMLTILKLIGDVDPRVRRLMT